MPIANNKHSKTVIEHMAAAAMLPLHLRKDKQICGNLQALSGTTMICH